MISNFIFLALRHQLINLLCDKLVVFDKIKMWVDLYNRGEIICDS